MQLGWNEIKQRAVQFSREWAGETREEAEAKSFWDAFFNVFGIPRRSVATFEEPVRKLGGQYGYIDLFWKGRLLVEHKSQGKSLDRAESQAFEYLQSLATEGRHDEIPRYVIVTDFDRLALYDLEPEDVRDLPLFCGLHVQRVEIRVKDLHRHVRLFGFIPGYKVRTFDQEDPINIKAAEVMGRLHDAMAAGGYTGHALERFLVRVLFCLFSEDTGIFDPNAFTEYIENQTRPDGSDLGMNLARLFQVLDTPREQRQKNLDERLLGMPYVNGGLFSETLPLADMNAEMRDALVRCTGFDWSRISPAVFGSLFQSIMQPEERRQIGAHYTSERDILKLVHALFLDDLRAEFETLKHDRRKLPAFHQKLGTLKFFDPACGCGNFLVITYRELRLLELEVLDALGYGGQAVTDIALLVRVDVDQMFGIEIEEWPARIAETALWLMDHQMNLLLAEKFGQYFVRLPLKKSARIVNDNALRLNWRCVINPAECSYILGNPPFVGAKFQDDEQRKDMAAVAGAVKNYGLLDYVTGWYFKAADFIKDTPVRVGFVSTNSITQGEQVGVLWNALFAQGMKIIFGHRTFPWQSEARGKAHVHVVMIGFAQSFNGTKRLYEEADGVTTVTAAKNISPYLIEGSDTAILNRSTPLCGVPAIGIGNKPIDGGNYLFTPEEKAAFLAAEPAAEPYFRRWLGSEEFINGIERWCLLLKDCPPDQLRRMPEAVKRVEAVRKVRQESKSLPTKKLAATPTRFHVENFPTTPFLVIPEVSSERRQYIPMAFMSPEEAVCSNKVRLLPSATLYHFGVLTSAMHMDWMRHVTGRLKSDYQYSVKLVYNNFPWPTEVADKKKAAVEAAAQAVLDVRAKYTTSTLADLYDPTTMPPDLVKAHADLDRAVDRCYRASPFTSDRQRVEFLFALYETIAAPLLPAEKKGKRR
ncbi:MAG: class I SAM-dependent DNA methyltransferase [Kiritimatiellae bacterium]|nr:class I SAM-dependent DNA methyltransferase [Kiritimatiellia bacterium]